ncbi:MAG: hypothetical protein IPJ13_24995 [Saprospiraceae bacterium]|nr:hypothetical protein [Saprospiraceae bacterium]
MYAYRRYKDRPYERKSGSISTSKGNNKMSHHHNLLRIVTVARALAELNNDVVFVGGAVVSLYSQKHI